MRRQLSSAAQVDPTKRRNGPARSLPDPAHGLRVTDNFGEIVPVGPRELEVLETYLGAMLDALLTNSG